MYDVHLLDIILAVVLLCSKILREQHLNEIYIDIIKLGTNFEQIVEVTITLLVAPS